MKNNDDTILEILQGHKTSKWPAAKLVKIFIASTKADFVHERRQLLEFVGPELQTYYDDQQIEVELVDMHFGASEKDSYDPELFQDHLDEIRTCHKQSRGCFFLCLIGDIYAPYMLPVQIPASQYDAILETANLLSENTALFQTWYEKIGETCRLRPYRDVPFLEWKEICLELISFLHKIVNRLPEVFRKKNKHLLQSAVEQQFNYAIGLAPGTAHHIVCVMRDFENTTDNGNHSEIDENVPISSRKSPEALAQFKNNARSLIPEENRFYFAVPWKEKGIDPEDDSHERYMKKFKNTVLTKLQVMLKKSFEDDPELKSRKKIVEENFQENITHLTLNYEDLVEFSNTDLVDKIKNMVINQNSRHPPIILYGNEGSGKTTFLRTIYRQFESWTNYRLLRIIRFISTTPRSSYALELLRVICQQICIALKLPDGFLPKDASFDPLFINNWFSNLVRKFEEMNQYLAIFIDDLHLLNPLDSEVMCWLPMSLPSNVQLICTTGVRLEQMRFTDAQKQRIKYIELPPVESSVDQVESSFRYLEKCFGQAAIAKLSCFLCSSEFGLTETELLELLMPTSNSEAVISIENANFNFSSFCSVRRKMSALVRDKIMSGKLLIEWRRKVIREIAMKRYLQSQETMRNTHAELANIFFSEFCDEENSESDDEPAPLLSDLKETPFQSTLHSDVTYRLRHVEESWIHLLKAGDVQKFKTLTMCNYDFMLAAVHTLSISYLRCILEHVRCYLLDREIELVYHTVRKATDILTRDTYQLGTQIITWLRPVSNDKSGGLMNSLVLSAMAWCDGFSLPLVVPLTDWLQPPLPSQSRSLTVSQVRLVEPAPSGQHVICVSDGDPQLWHIMSNQLIHTFRGHSREVLCMTVPKQSQYLITGSDDTTIIVWDMRAFKMTCRICEHIAPVTCIATALNNSTIISGGEDSSIIISSLSSGELILKMDHHRGPITSLKVTSGDVLISASVDGNVCLWSLEDYSLLNTIPIQAPIKMIDISPDSVFLLVLCADNNLYLRTVATGTELHNLGDHKGVKVNSMCLTQDNCRAVVGLADGKVVIYDVHSGKDIKILTNHSDAVTAVRVTDKDDFLITGSLDGKVIFYPFRTDDNMKDLNKVNKKSHHHPTPHFGWITSMDIARDGQIAASGATDNLVNIWQLNSHELLLSLTGHKAPISCINFAPNSLFVASSSEDKTVKVWGLTLGTLVSNFTGHLAPVVTVVVMMDSSRIISSDRNDTLCIWLADNGNLLQQIAGPSKSVHVTNNMKYAVCTNADTSLKIWSLIRDEEKFTVSHSEEITCFVLTMDSQHLITGSRDMSLKVWQVAGGKLSQVLIGHTDTVTCVAVSLSEKNQVISGSRDSNLIVWDINTGADMHTLTAHLGFITCVKVSADGSIAISGSEDRSIIIWDAKRGLPLTSLQMHLPIINIEASSDFSRILVHMRETKYVPIICLHNTPAKYVKLPTYCAPDKEILDNPKAGPKRQMRRLLKKEVSLDTYTWQKKYAHLTSNVVIPAVDERFKRRFSVSASMEEISKIPQSKEPQPGMGNKQGSLAQSQHFDQLEALWNKRSPPRRRLHQSLSKQSSLAESHLDFSDEDQFEEM